MALNEMEIILIGMGTLTLICLIFTIILYKKMKKFEKAYLALQTFVSGKSLEELLENNLKETKSLGMQNSKQEKQLEKIEQRMRKSVDGIGFVKFNSFQTMRGDLSFSLAMLDQEGSGVVLTNIHSIEESRLYARLVEKGQALSRISSEEQEAIEKAKETIKI